MDRPLLALMYILALGLLLLAGCAGSAEAPATALSPTAITQPAPTPTSIPPATTRPTPTLPVTSTPTTATVRQPQPSANLTTTPTAALADEPLSALRVQRAFPNLAFRRLTNLAQPQDAPDRIFVTEQAGLVRAFPNDPQATEAVVFLDIRDRVSEAGNEEGLLGLAFDPDYAANGHFYVYYSADSPRRSVVSRFTVLPDDPTAANPDSELVIMEIPQPYSNHNGGQLAFGPDGYLYVGLGDGGSRGDPMGNGQDLGTLLGTILRVDVAGASVDGGYAVPSDNPFVGVQGARPEIWAYGLRNPWRFSFDRETGALWAGDVGQNRWEETDLVEKGRNYGWNIAEGHSCFSPSTGCDAAGLEPPVAVYGRGDGCSVTGGYVYRGSDMPALAGVYVYGDFCSGKIWGLRYNGEAVAEQALLVDSGLSITSFGEDAEGNLYVLSRDQGIYRLAPA